MEPGSAAASSSPISGRLTDAGVKVIAVEGPIFELADGTHLVPEGDVRPARIEDGSHVFTLADAMAADAGPFAGYVRR